MRTALAAFLLSAALVAQAAAVTTDVLTRYFGEQGAAIAAPATPEHKPVVELVSQRESKLKCGKRGCVCNAYGKVGSRWTTISGSHRPTEDAARKDAVAECQRRGGFACGSTGCWPE